jgi:polyphosphate:AMP phosphotransferase
MFQTAELGQSVEKDAYKAEVAELRLRLLELQNRLKQADMSVIVVIAGVEGAGKSETVNVLHEWFDPRFLTTHAFTLPTEEERAHPPFWRFWRAMPADGTLGIFFGSWYTTPIIGRVEGNLSEAELTAEMDRINAFERALVADRTLLLKFWFHLSKKAQAKRMKKLEADPEESWRVTKRDWQLLELYDEFRAASEQAVGLTQTAEAPWTVVEATDARFRNLAVGRQLASELSRALDAHDGAVSARKAERAARLAAGGEGAAGVVRLADTVNLAGTGPIKTVLSSVDLSRHTEDAAYKEQLIELQGRFAKLCRKFSARELSLVLAFEGWDAAGKGGVIRRVASAMDARHYSIIPIAAPTDEERAHHYLWRFWRHVPRPGRVTIFDRSWYGRVLVERVEGFASEAEWSRAYGEINEFERELVEFGAAVHKFWMHIDKEEQLRRFEERAATPWKQFKITPEDWRNRERWDAYELAVHDMVERTSTTLAPWTLVPSNCKRTARLCVLDTLCKAMEARLEDQPGSGRSKKAEGKRRR